MASSSRTHEAFASSSSSSSSKPWKYDVFLSFRGEDTRKTFTDHLHTALEKSGINVFIDNNELPRGENITAELVQAIQGSRISLIVFSRRYTDSSWCLEELVQIMECRTTLGQMVLPIFYNVDPSDVRKQTGSFGEAFDQKHKDVDEDKVKRWRAALTEAAKLSGRDLRNTADGHEAKFIRKIIDEDINRELITGTNLSVADHPVGINSRLQDVLSHIGVGSKEVRMVGIWGMGGLGKTTLAKAIYNQFCHSFQGKSFLADIRETAKQPNGLVRLQEQLLSDLLTNKIEVGHVAKGSTLIKERLRCKKVLVIIDDVDQKNQLDAIAGNRDWFGPGSIIILTTRNEDLLKQLKVDPYPAQAMNEEEALQLFSWHAFRTSCPNEGYIKLSESVVSYCGGLPLALKVLGSFLFEMTITEWESALKKLEAVPDHAQIEKRLKISFDGLSKDGKDIFLDISCLFIGRNKNYVTKILDACGFSAALGIRVLLQRCLITISETNQLMMHDLLRDMGREIVRAKSPDEPGKYSRLWDHEDVTNVLTDKSGTVEIQGLRLERTFEANEPSSFSTEAFVNMTKLRFLHLGFINLTGDYKYLPNNIRWLCWLGFPSEFIPNDFNLKNLVCLELWNSELRQVWKESKLLGKLEILDLSNSDCLTQSPDFSNVPNLKKLVLKDCDSLSEIHRSIGNLKRLSLVNLEGCSMLKDLPRSFYKLKSIGTLVLIGCLQLEKLDEDLGDMVSLTTLELHDTAIIEVPSTIVRLEKLRRLSLSTLQGPLGLPLSLCGLTSLESLYLSKCNLSYLTENAIGSLPSLEVLDIGCGKFRSLPSSSLSGISKLKKLVLFDCENLCETPDLPTNLEELTVYGGDYNALERMPSEMSNMRILRLYSFVPCKLIEIPGLDKSLNSMTEIRLEECRNLTATFKNSILQGWTSSGYGGIDLPGNDIPEWFTYVREGDTVSFQVPQFSGHNLKGLTLCFIYCDRFISNPFDIPICVANVTKRTHLQAQLKPSRGTIWSESNYLWQSQISNDVLNLQVGDKVIISREAMMKTGVSLVWDKVMNEAPHCGFNPYDYSQVYSDSDWEELNNTMLGDDEAGSSHDACDEDRPHKRLSFDPINRTHKRLRFDAITDEENDDDFPFWDREDDDNKYEPCKRLCGLIPLFCCLLMNN